MRVLVTGASGFIGGRVLASVCRRGWEAVGTTHSDRVANRDRFVTVDITRPGSFSSIRSIGPFDAVVHCAGLAHRSSARRGEDFDRVNVDGTKNVGRLAVELGAKQIIHLSSVMVYGRHGTNICESDECHPNDAYALSKLRGEEGLIGISGDTELSVTILRPAPVIGEGCKGNFVRLIRAIDKGRFISVGDGRNLKSLIYVGDVAEACVRLIEQENSDQVEIFNLAAPPIGTKDLLYLVSKSLGKRQVPFRLPTEPLMTALRCFARLSSAEQVVSAARSLETWISEDVYSTSSIRERHGFETPTTITDAVERTVAAYRSESAD